MSDNIITFTCFGAIWAGVCYISHKYIYKEKRKVKSPNYNLSIILNSLLSTLYGIICMRIYEAILNKFKLINTINTFSPHILPICMFSLGIAYLDNLYWKNIICLNDNFNNSKYDNFDDSLSNKQHKLNYKILNLTEQCDVLTGTFDVLGDSIHCLKSDIVDLKSEIDNLKSDINDLKKRTVEFEKVLMCPVKMNLLYTIENENKQVIDTFNQIIMRLNSLESYCVDNGTIQIGI